MEIIMEKVLKNMMEPLVQEKLDETLQNCDCCKCDVCKMDMMSYALNHLPPKYVVTHIGTLYAKLETVSNQHEADVLTAIMKAIIIVSKNPRHEIVGENKI
ncbi:MAG: late competence development ComFB family protein [Oscillospiraceae bacterium]